MVNLKTLFLFLILALTPVTGFTRTSPYLLAPGESVILPVSSRHAVQVSGSKIIKVRDLGSRIKITGQKLGSVTVTQGHRRYEVEVIAKPLWKTWRQIQESIGAPSPIFATVQNKEVLIQGSLLNLSDFENLKSLKTQERFFFEAEVPAQLQPALRRIVTQVLDQQGLPSVSLSFVPFPQLNVPNATQEQFKEYQDSVRAYGIRVSHQKMRLPLRSSVDLTLSFVEARTQWLKTVGIQWPSSQPFQLLPQWQGGSQLSVLLNAAESQGNAHLYASPRLVSRSGEKAEFHSGGEFPIRVSGFQNQSLFWKKYGLILSTLPKVDSSGALTVDLDFELSSIDQSRSVDGLPGLLSHKLSTKVELAFPHPFIISSFVRRDQGSSEDGLSGFRKIPLLGALFESRNYLDQKTELIIFVEPKIINSDSSEDGFQKGNVNSKLNALKQSLSSIQ